MENGSKKWPFSTRYLKRKFLQSHVLEIYLLLEERRSKGQTKMTHIQMSCLKLACYSFVRICLQVYVGFAGNLPVFQSWVDCHEGGGRSCEVSWKWELLVVALWAAQYSMRWIL